MSQQNGLKRLQLVQRGSRVLELDGLRAFAFLAVFIFHTLNIPLLWAGVDMFFALSGFLITQIILKGVRAKGFFKTFYIRRTLRIFPAYYLSILLALLLVGSAASAMLPWAITYGGNFYRALIEDPSPLMPLWSLAVEEQFYLLWPIALFFTPLKRVPQLIALLVLVAPAFRFMVWHIWGSNASAALLPSRMDALLAGAAIAYLVHVHGLAFLKNRQRPIAVLTSLSLLVLVGLAGTYGSDSVLYATFGHSASAVAFAGVLALVLTNQNSLRLRLLRLTPIVYVGQISYGMYLYHFIIIWWLRQFGLNQLEGILLATLLTFGLAVLSWHLVESPINELRHRVGAANAGLEPSRAS